MRVWSTTTPAMLAALSDAVRGRVVDGITVQDADAVLELGVDDEQIVHLTLVLDDPAPDRTWPHDKLRAIDRMVRDEGYRLAIDEFVYIGYRRAGAAHGAHPPRHRSSR
jgi:hypothetical protein